MRKPWRSRKVAVEKNNGRYDERIPPIVRSSGDYKWRRGRRRKTKGGWSMKKKNDRRTKKDERRVKNACFSTRGVGTLVPSSCELKLTLGPSCSVEGCGTHNGWWPMGYDD
jgi:hypothetical protein